MGRINSHLWVGIGIWALGAAIAFHIAGFIRSTFHLNKFVSLGIGIVLAPLILWLLYLILEKVLNRVLGESYTVVNKTGETENKDRL